MEMGRLSTFALNPPPTKVPLMEALQALVLTNAQLHDMLTDAAKEGAKLAVTELRADLHQTPEDATLQQLRAYLSDPASIPNPHELWAHADIIRRIEATPRSKPKSASWFMKFQRQTGLKDCRNRPGPAHGRRREWTFMDIKLAWDAYYRGR
jgi:hypothetical protein